MGQAFCFPEIIIFIFFILILSYFSLDEKQNLTNYNYLK